MKTLNFKGKEYLVVVRNYISDQMAMGILLKEVFPGTDLVKAKKIADDFDFCLTVNLGNYQSRDRNDPCASFVQPFCSFINVNSPNADMYIDLIQKTGL